MFESTKTFSKNIKPKKLKKQIHFIDIDETFIDNLPIGY
jgi:predicted secreted acid phosphatase